MPPEMDVPNLEECLEPIEEVVLIISSSSSSSGGDSLETVENVRNFDGELRPPNEQNLRDLLIQVSSTENLESVTQIRLRVISREISLQNLNIYMPALRELVLDGSVISSLRDLGCCLRNLRVLKINRCGLSCLDGVLQFENLEELYAADNRLEDCSACCFLAFIKIIDFSGNNLNDVRSISYLKLCGSLERISFSRNEGIVNIPNYRQIVKESLPNLKFLDGEAIREGDSVQFQEFRRDAAFTNGFVVSFPPRLSLTTSLMNRNVENAGDKEFKDDSEDEN